MAPAALACFQVGRIVRGDYHAFEKQGFMAVNQNVYLVFFQKTHIHAGHPGFGCSEKNVRDFGGDHGPAPSIGKGRAGALFDDIIVVLVNTHMRAVHEFHNLTHRAARNDSGFAPLLQGLCGHAFCEGNFTLDLGVCPFEFLVEVCGYVFDRPVSGLDSNAFGNISEFLFVLNLKMRNPAVHHLSEHIQHSHAVIGMGGAARGHGTRKITGRYGIDGRAANAGFRVRVPGVQPARTHEAVFAACAFGPDGTGFHVARPMEH